MRQVDLMFSIYNPVYVRFFPGRGPRRKLDWLRKSSILDAIPPSTLTDWYSVQDIFKAKEPLRFIAIHDHLLLILQKLRE